MRHKDNILLLWYFEENKPETNLYRLDEGVEVNPDADGASEELDEPGSPEEPEEADLDDTGGVNDAASDCDEIKPVPTIFEVGLKDKLF